MEPSPPLTDASVTLLALYDAHVGRVFSYLYRRCSDRAIAEELTSETFAAALDGLRRNPPRAADVGWLLGIARHKLVDHWRRRARDERNLRAVSSSEPDSVEIDLPWVDDLDGDRAAVVLGRLAPHYRLALTLRYLDELSVPAMAELLGRSVHSTESLLARARQAFRESYREGERAHHDS